MRVLLTGATGFIGSAVASELREAGHSILALARSDQTADTLARRGLEVQRGDLSDLPGLADAARSSDGVVHLAFGHDFSKFQENIDVNNRAVEATATALHGSHKPFVIASGTLLASGRTGTEEDPVASDDRSSRGAAETLVLNAGAQDVRGVVVRLPPTVHGKGDRGFVPQLIAIARQTGVAAIVGDGSNRWPAVHRLDAARLFRLAIERANSGAILHAVAEEGIPMREIAGTIADGTGVPVRSIGAGDAPAHFTWMARFVQIDNPTSSANTRRSLGWGAGTQPLARRHERQRLFRVTWRAMVALALMGHSRVTRDVGRASPSDAGSELCALSSAHNVGLLCLASAPGQLRLLDRNFVINASRFIPPSAPSTLSGRLRSLRAGAKRMGQ